MHGIAGGKAARPDYIVDSIQALWLESALIRDSLTYSAHFIGSTCAYTSEARRRSGHYGIHIQPREGVSSRVAEVKVQEGESIESALRRFKRKVQQEDIIKDIKKHSFYLKPGEKRRTKEALARKRNRKKRVRDVE